MQAVVVVRNARRNRLAQVMFPAPRRDRGARLDLQGLCLLRFGGAAIAVIVDVFVKDVDLPQRAVRIADPELGLPRVAALDALFALGLEAGRFEPALDLDQLLGGPDAKPDMVQGAAGRPAARDERQHQRRFGELELGVVLP